MLKLRENKENLQTKKSIALKERGVISSTKEKLKNGENGITLIALVITIIVLLILAGISINMLTGQNGLLKQAGKAKEITGIAQIKEAIDLSVTSAFALEPLGDLTTENLETALAQNMPTDTEYVLSGDETSGWIVEVPSIDKTYEIDSSGAIALIEPLKPEDTEPDSTTTFSTEYGTIDVIWLSGTTNTVASTPNAPILTSNEESMTPVTWTYDSSTSTWSEDSTAQSTWYSYNAVSSRNEDGSTVDNLTSMWANAKTANESYFVWIPRFAYRITYYSSADSTTPTGYYDGWGMWNATDGTVKYALDEGVETVTYNGKKYIVHPAFETDLDLGGWSSELSGFWFAKYEMTGSVTALTSKPNTASLRSMTIGAQYQAARNATYGYIGVPETITSGGTNYTYTSYMSSHMVKNSEWGAVAYLTQSQYGRNGNEIDINNSSSYITGNGGGSTSAFSASGTTNAYNTATGAKASTTGNVYGIYDMSGGAYERAAGYDKLGSSSYLADSTYGLLLTQEAKDSSGNYISTKYATAYSNGIDTYYGTELEHTVGKVGDATKEVNTQGGTNASRWFADDSFLMHSSGPFVNRGGLYYYGSGTGVFCSNDSYAAANGYSSFRAVLCP